MSAKNLNFMNTVPIPGVKKSVFDLTHDVKLSCNMGQLVPVMVMDCVPGDRVKISTESMVKLMPLVAPMMHRCKITFHTWAVPYRILWPGYSDYFTETKTAGVLPAFPTHKVLADGSNWGKLHDYLGVPPPTPLLGSNKDETISAMRFAAYQAIYSENYRDENLLDPIDYNLVDGDNNANAELYVLRKRAWGSDYFTSNLPFAQKGDPVLLPVTIADSNVYRNADPAIGTPAGQAFSEVPVPNVSFPISGNDLDIENRPNLDPTIGNESLYADNQNAQATSLLNDLRTANAIQKYLERAARAGTRLVEWIKGMFDETLPDYTANRPQYIGGAVSELQIGEVLSTAETTTLPQANMAGRGMGILQGKQGFYKAREHCVIMTIMSVMPETVYQQGIERTWFKVNDPKEYINPMFAHLGERPTYGAELMAYQSGNMETFGYLPQYAEDRTIPNRVAGEMRTTLNYWTMSRIFNPGSVPLLNSQFIECDPTHRVFADTDPSTDKLVVHVLNRVLAVRPLPKYGTPQL